MTPAGRCPGADDAGAVTGGVGAALAGGMACEVLVCSGGAGAAGGNVTAGGWPGCAITFAGGSLPILP